MKITTSPVQKVEIKVKGAKDVETEVSRDPLAGVECFTKTINRLESNLDELRARANAWAVGDVEKLRQLHSRMLAYDASAVDASDCVTELAIGSLAGGFESGSAIETTIQQVLNRGRPARQEAARQWLEATESALATNRSTFAVMPIDSLLDPSGYLKKLRERGYSVEEPDAL